LGDKVREGREQIKMTKKVDEEEEPQEKVKVGREGKDKEKEKVREIDES
jgi:hypothetical protein